MSEENLEVVRLFYEFWRSRDWAIAEEHMHPDAIVDVSRNVFNPGVHRGVDGIREFMKQVDEMWEEFRIDPEEIIDAGEVVVVRNRVTGKGRGSGAEAEMTLFGIVKFRDGKISEFVGGLRSREEAFAAAGLPDQP
jgi:ketosteroid isomerase-like protein